MARDELISKQDGAMWLRIVFKPILTLKIVMKMKNDPNTSLKILSVYGSSGCLMPSDQIAFHCKPAGLLS